MAGFEPAASCSQSRRANQAAPHPVGPRSLSCHDRSRAGACAEPTGAPPRCQASPTVPSGRRALHRTRGEAGTLRYGGTAPAFQAGHEGSIPFARSNPKPQVSGVVESIVPTLLNTSAPGSRPGEFLLGDALGRCLWCISLSSDATSLAASLWHLTRRGDDIAGHQPPAATLLRSPPETAYAAAYAVSGGERS